MEKDRFELLQEKLAERQKEYDEQVDEDLLKVDIQNSVLADCMKNQIELQMTWDELYADVDGIVQELEEECELMFSIAFKELLNDSYKKLGVQEAKIYAQSNMDYVETKRVKIQAENLKSKVNVVVDALKTRKYILKNLADVLHQGNDSYII